MFFYIGVACKNKLEGAMTNESYIIVGFCQSIY